MANFRGHGHGRGGVGSGFLIRTQNVLIIGTGPTDIRQTVTGSGYVIHNYGTMYIINPGADARQVLALSIMSICTLRTIHLFVSAVF